MDFWRSALEAAEKAASAAKDLGKKGLEVVEATAEEANKKLNLNLHEKVGAGPAKQAPPSQQELAAFGITPEFEEFVRTLNYSVFRDFPAEHLLPADNGLGGTSSSGAATAAYQLNPWQVRHATLVVQALKEVNELRFVLCPKYMTDEHFWHVYFTLARKYLPDKAFSWSPSDVLPTFGGDQSGGASNSDSFSFSGLSTQLMQLGSKLQTAATVGRQRGLELTASLASAAGAPSSSSSGAAAGTSGAWAAGAGAAAAGAGAGMAAVGAVGGTSSSQPVPPSGMLAEDPDLEAYLQVAISSSHAGSAAGEEEEGSSGYAVGEEDLDLDSYIQELAEEVAAAEGEEEEGSYASADEAAGADGSEDDSAAAVKED